MDYIPEEPTEEQRARDQAHAESGVVLHVKQAVVKARRSLLCLEDMPREALALLELAELSLERHWRAMPHK